MEVGFPKEEGQEPRAEQPWELGIPIQTGRVRIFAADFSMRYDMHSATAVCITSLGEAVAIGFPKAGHAPHRSSARSPSLVLGAHEGS